MNNINEDNIPYLIVIFGKNGCPHCARLREEVGELIEEANYKGKFALDYQNLSTFEGMISYAGAETVNGQRIPTIQLMRYDKEKRTYIRIPDKRGEILNTQNGRLFVPVYLQLETDYSSGGKEISKEEICSLLTLAEMQ